MMLMDSLGKRLGLNNYQMRLLITVFTFLSGSVIAAIWFFIHNNLVPGLVSLALPLAVIFVAYIFVSPVTVFYAAFIANYFVMGLARYLPGPLGLAVDGLLVLTYISLLFSQFNAKVEWKNVKNQMTIVALLWYMYILFELFNPEAVSRVAWFYAMRGIGFYMLLTIPLTFILLNDKRHLDRLLFLWAVFTLVGVIKGAMQLYIGPDPWEKYWLATVGGKTHLLAQGLRVFSFFTDAATYGGSMAYSGVVFTITGLSLDDRKKKYFYLFVAVMAFYGMFISGTRGALAVPFSGFALYAILSKKIKILVTGFISILLVYSFLKFTTIGSGVYAIRRFRTALDPENPSLMVRKENQKLLKVYLADRPFGGGIGSAGNWGLRFSPDTFLAQTPTDSWYVQIWAEQGVVGLTLHILILGYVMASGIIIILFRLRSKELTGKAIALSSGMFGIMVASYGSGALGQMPNGIIVYMSIAFIQMMPRWESLRQKAIPAGENQDSFGG